MWVFYLKLWCMLVIDHLTVATISRASLIIADLIVIFVTWVTTYKTAAASRRVLNHTQPTLSGLLLRDGTLYFM